MVTLRRRGVRGLCELAVSILLTRGRCGCSSRPAREIFIRRRRTAAPRPPVMLATVSRVPHAQGTLLHHPTASALFSSFLVSLCGSRLLSLSCPPLLCRCRVRVVRRRGGSRQGVSGTYLLILWRRRPASAPSRRRPRRPSRRPSIDASACGSSTRARRFHSAPTAWTATVLWIRRSCVSLRPSATSPRAPTPGWWPTSNRWSCAIRRRRHASSGY